MFKGYFVDDIFVDSAAFLSKLKFTPDLYSNETC